MIGAGAYLATMALVTNWVNEPYFALLLSPAVGFAQEADAETGSDAPAISATVQTIAGENLFGELESLSPDEVVVETEAGSQSVGTDEVLAVRFGPKLPEGAAPPAEPRPIDRRTLSLVDGSVVFIESIVAEGRTATLALPDLGSLAIPADAVKTIRFGDGKGGADEKLFDRWSELVERGFSKDVLVVNRDGQLDFVQGTVGDITAEKVSFLLNGNTLEVEKPKLYGVIFDRDAASAAAPGPAVLPDGQQLRFAAASLTEAGALSIRANLGTGELTVPAEQLRSLDFSGQKLAYLSDLDPLVEEYIYKFGDADPAEVWVTKMRRDHRIGPAKLRTGRQVFRKGLWLHPDTRLVYRLGREFKRLQAVVGIDADIAPKGGLLQLTIRGDGQVLVSRRVKGSDEPFEVDLDLSTVRELEIHVSFANTEAPLALDGQLVFGRGKLLK